MRLAGLDRAVPARRPVCAAHRRGTTVVQDWTSVAGMAPLLSRRNIMETLLRAVQLSAAQAYAASGGFDANEVT